MRTNNYCYEYPRPALTVDAFILAFIEGKIRILLIKRADEPYKDYWAFPGGFVDEGESAEVAMVRELYEETGLKDISFEQVYTATKPGRDPRGWNVSVVFLGFMPTLLQTARAGDDASDVSWFSLDSLPALAFDHSEIIEIGLDYIKKKMRFLWVTKLLLGEHFSQDEFLQIGIQLGLNKNHLLQRLNRFQRAGIIVGSSMKDQLQFDLEKLNKIF